MGHETHETHHGFSVSRWLRGWSLAQAGPKLKRLDDQVPRLGLVGLRCLGRYFVYPGWWFGTCFSRILGIVIPTDQYFRRGSNHQPVSFPDLSRHYWWNVFSTWMDDGLNVAEVLHGTIFYFGSHGSAHSHHSSGVSSRPLMYRTLD